MCYSLIIHKHEKLLLAAVPEYAMDKRTNANRFIIYLSGLLIDHKSLTRLGGAARQQFMIGIILLCGLPTIYFRQNSILVCFSSADEKAPQ